MPPKKDDKEEEKSSPLRQRLDPDEETPEEDPRVARDVSEIQRMLNANSSHYAGLRESLSGATLGGRDASDLLAPVERFSNMLLDTGMLLARQGLLSGPGQSSGQRQPIDPATMEAIARIERAGRLLFSGLGAIMQVMAEASDRTQQAEGGAATSGSAAAFQALLESSAAAHGSAASLSALLQSGAPASLGAALGSGAAASSSAGGSERPAGEPMESSPQGSEESSGEDEESRASKKPKP